MKKISVTRSSMPPLEEYVEMIRPLWESRWISNRGSISLEFEEKLKERMQAPNIWLFANGHLALEVTISSLKLNGEVITTPYTHCSTIHSIVRNGLKPVFVDVKEEDFTINPELIEKHINKNTTAIVATHVYGCLCDTDTIGKIAKRYGLKVIYDAAHAFGVKYKGIDASNFGDAAMFSTHATKVFHTIEGGIVTYGDAEMFSSLASLVNFGFTSPDCIEYIGTNARMNEFEAAMGLCNLKYFDEELAKRKRVAQRYEEHLEGRAGIKIIKPGKEIFWNYAYFPVIFDGYKYNRNEIKAKLEKKNIFARKYFYPVVNKAECYRAIYGGARNPVAEHAAECVLALPMYAELTLKDVDRICDEILH